MGNIPIIPNIPNQEEYKNLQPFDLVLIQKFPFIEEDFDAINTYGIINKIKDYLNNVIANEQSVTTNQQNVFEGFVDLHNYVEDYFINLDVQQEINNKLNEMAEDGTLENLLNYKNVQFLFPKSCGNIQSGDCSLIKAYNKSILIDTHRKQALDEIISFLIRNNINTLDYVILTHYHDDHVENFEKLVERGYINENTFVYLPAFTNLIYNSDMTTNFYNSINNILEINNIEHKVPTELETLIIEDFKLTFYNCSTDIFQNYDDYNDCSTVCYVEYGNIKSLFTSDINDKPFERFNKLNYFTNLDFYKVEHHGINYSSQNAIHFLRRTLPRFAVQLAELEHELNNIICQGSTTAFLKNNNCKLFSSFNNQNDIIFDLSKDTISVESGIPNISQSNRPIELNIYVDSLTNNIIQNGTIDYPFKDLQQALSKLSNNDNSIMYIINLADGNYSNNNSTADQSKITSASKIKIKSINNDNTKVIINNSILCYNNSILEIENVTIKGLINTSNSILNIKNCIFDTNGNNNSAVYGTNSRIFIEETTIKNMNVAISCHYDELHAINNDFIDCNIAIQNQYGNVYLKDNNYNNVNKKLNLFNNAKNLSSNTANKELIFNGNTSNGDIQLLKSINEFNMLFFTFGSVSGANLVSSISMPYSGDGEYRKGETYTTSFVVTQSGTPTPGILKFQVDENDETLLHIIMLDPTNSIRDIYGINIDNLNI